MAHRPPPHPELCFHVAATVGEARAATFETPHGIVHTPAFMPVGTRASLKGLTNAQIEALAPEVLLANTYHLHLRPGEDVVRDMGGLHAFTGWRRPILTDSGGYQVFSLATRTRIDDHGADVRSHLDGKRIRLGPEEAMAIQEALGADLVMAFDHCVGLPADRARVEAGVERTTRWTARCAEVRTRDDQALFGIVQGGVDEALRARSADELVALDLPGYAIGGLAVGETPDELRRVTAFTAARLPADRPRYLMGVGLPRDLLDAIAVGVDVFDCVVPTRHGRRGNLLTAEGPLRITSRSFARDTGPVDPTCPCEVCRGYSRGYLRHLFKVGEHLALTLGSIHNTAFLVNLVRRARSEILAGTFDVWHAEFDSRYAAGEARFEAEKASDPHAAKRSRAARAEDDARSDP